MLKVLLSGIVIVGAVWFLYSIFKDFKFSSVNWRRRNKELERENEEYNCNK